MSDATGQDEYVILTQYHGPTDFGGSRIMVTHQGRQLTVPYRHMHDPRMNHLLAAKEIVRAGGEDPNDFTYTEIEGSATRHMWSVKPKGTNDG